MALKWDGVGTKLIPFSKTWISKFVRAFLLRINTTLGKNTPFNLPSMLLAILLEICFSTAKDSNTSIFQFIYTFSIERLWYKLTPYAVEQWKKRC